MVLHMASVALGSHPVVEMNSRTKLIILACTFAAITLHHKVISVFLRCL